jgi:putative phosphoesterase
MKKILLLSDTHSYIDDAILKHVELADEVWHAGDVGNFEVIDAIKKLKPLRVVYGNIDDAKMRAEYPEHLLFNCENVSVYMTHIGGYPPKYNNRSRPIIYEQKPKLYICGHSHILKVMPDKKLNLIHMNPGAVGKHGFHKVRTMLKFQIDGTKIEKLEVVEFQNRY